MPISLGPNQLGECMRCGGKYLASQLQFDGRNPRLLVCPTCWDPAHPQERPFVVNDVEGVPRYPVAPEILDQTSPVLDGIQEAVGTIDLTWTAGDTSGVRFERYDVYRSTDSGASFSLLQSIDIEYNNIGGITNDPLTLLVDPVSTGHQFKVAAVDGAGGSLTSNVLTVTVQAPGSFTLSSAFDGIDTVTLTWTTPTVVQTTLAEFNVYRRLEGTVGWTLIDTVGPTVLTADDTPPFAGQYEYYVEAVAANGLATNSNEISVLAAIPQFMVATSLLSNAIFTSPDGVTWTQRTTPAMPFALTSVAFAPQIGAYVATLQDAILRSTDGGISWASVPIAGAWRAIAWSSTLLLFCMVSGTGGIATSPDGITWTAQTPAAGTTSLVDVIWDDRTAKFYAAGQGGAHRVQYSSDGVNWTRASGSDANGGAYHMASSTVGSGDDLIVLASNGNLSMFYSADGAVWSSTPSAYGSGSTACGYGGGKFVQGSPFGNRGYSDTGSSGWTQGSGAALSWVDFAYSETLGKFVGVGIDGSGNNLTAHSTDGIAWTSFVFGHAANAVRIIAVFMD